jgi:hypothetical protein
MASQDDLKAELGVTAPPLLDLITTFPHTDPNNKAAALFPPFSPRNPSTSPDPDPG